MRQSVLRTKDWFATVRGYHGRCQRKAKILGKQPDIPTLRRPTLAPHPPDNFVKLRRNTPRVAGIERKPILEPVQCPVDQGPETLKAFR